jgi:murein DD-endopeptidase MepM/ murein hydrolase activator NlpD
MKKYILILMIILLAAGFLVTRSIKQALQSNPTSLPSVSSSATVTSPQISPTITPTSNALANPVADFKARVTKKPFGIYITPQNSPIQPERFTGYHTGADAEYQDITDDVPVYAVADGKVVLSKTASGYGGVFMIEILLNGTKHTVLYGHIRPSSLPKVGTQVTKGKQLAVLGTGYSTETDGERRHLHFTILATNALDIRGYVQSESQLSGWLDPLTFY